MYEGTQFQYPICNIASLEMFCYLHDARNIFLLSSICFDFQDGDVKILDKKKRFLSKIVLIAQSNETCWNKNSIFSQTFCLKKKKRKKALLECESALSCVFTEGTVILAGPCRHFMHCSPAYSMQS